LEKVRKMRKKRILSVLLAFVMALPFTALSVSADVGFAGGKGTVFDPYQVSTPEQLDNVRNYLDKHFIQICDVDLTEATTEGGIFYNNGEGWTPISTFTGSYNGGGYKIIGLNHNSSKTQYIGLFGRTDGANIGNIKLINCNIKSTYSSGYCGGIVGYAGSNTTIENCFVSGVIGGNVNCAGGIIGYLGIVYNCTNEAVVTGEYAGGICGAGAEEISNCFNSGNVSSNLSAGGIVGRNSNNVNYCYNIGNVNGEEYAGGISGYSYSNSGTGEFEISNCFNSGNVSSNQSAGGIIGNIVLNDSKKAYLKNFYNLGNVTSEEESGEIFGRLTTYSSVNMLFLEKGYNSNINLENRIYGTLVRKNNSIVSVASSNIYQINEDATEGVTVLSAEEMKKKESFVGFDFENVWTISPFVNDGYPYLRNMPGMHYCEWGEFEITKEPTETETGTAQKVCAGDDTHIDIIEIPVLTDENVWTKGEYTAPTYLKEGLQVYTSEYGTVNHIIKVPNLTSTTTKVTDTYTRFYVEFQQDMKNCIIIISIYDEATDKIEEVSIYECDGDDFYTITIPKVMASKNARIYVWDNFGSMMPLGIPENVIIE